MTIVRRHLEYASSVWNPHHKLQIMISEDVQRRSTKLLPVLKERSYEERLHQPDLPTVVYRRARGDVVETYKLLTGKYDTSLPSFLCLSRHQCNARGHHLKLQYNHGHRNRGAHEARAPPLLKDSRKVPVFVLLGCLLREF